MFGVVEWSTEVKILQKLRTKGVFIINPGDDRSLKVEAEFGSGTYPTFVALVHKGVIKADPKLDRKSSATYTLA